MANEYEFFEAEVAESAVIGAILLDSSCFDEARKILLVEDFSTEFGKKAYSKICELNSKGKTADYATLVSEGFDRKTMLNAMESISTTAAIKDYSVAVKVGAMKRNLQGLSDEITADLLVGTNPEDIIEKVKEFTEKAQPIGETKAMTSADSMKEFFIYRRYLDKHGNQAIMTGYSNLDEILGVGLVKGGFYVVAARPGVGKTTFSSALADSIAKKKKRTLFFSLEMTMEQMAARRLGRSTAIPYGKVVLGSLSNEEYGKLTMAASELSESPLLMRSSTGVTTRDVEKEIIACHPDIVIVDYIGLLRPLRNKKSRYEEMTDISGELKRLAMKYKIPIIGLAQLNRENTKIGDKRPNMAHLRDSGAIEQDADGIMLLHRPAYYETQKEKEIRESKANGDCESLEIIVAKNRHGKTGTAYMSWYGATGIIVPTF